MRSVPGLGARNLHARFATLRRSGPLRVAIGPRSYPLAFLHMRFRMLSFRAAAARGIFLAVDRRHMRRISVEIRPPDSIFLAVFIDPFPQGFSGSPSLLFRR